VIELEKFEIDSPKSQTSGSKSSRYSLKDLMNESFSSYIKKVSIEYSQFKNNHYSKRQFQSGIDSSVYIVNNSTTNLSYFSRNNPNSSLNSQNYFYQPNSKIFQKIPKEFLTNVPFKISNEILEKKSDLIQKYCKDMIEMCGEIDYEIEKILEHSVKLYNYINYNMQPLCDQLEFALFKVKEMKKSKEFLRVKFLTNSSLTIKKEIKKRNFLKAYTIVNHFNSLKEILNLLKVLSANQAKFKVSQELISKAGDIINEIKKICKSNNQFQNTMGQKNKNENFLKLIKIFEEEFAKFSQRSTDNIIQEFSNLIKEQLENSIRIRESNENINIEDKQNTMIPNNTDQDINKFNFYKFVINLFK
jgi:hypothetical protein